MNRTRVNPFVSGLSAALVLVVVMTAVFITGIPGGPQIPLPWSQKMTLHVQLANADALAPHASVEVAGVKVGEVQSVDAQGTLALATLQIGEQWADIHTDATVYLRAHGLFGPKYIAITPGTSGAPRVADGGTLNVNQTVQPVDLNAILQDLQAPEQQNLRTTIVELGQAAAGRGDEVNHLLAASDSLSQVLDAPIKAVGNVAPNLSDTLVNDDAFNAAFAQTPLDQLVANSEVTWQQLADNAGHLESLLTHANSTLASLDSALNGQAGNIQNIVHQLGQTNGTVDKLTNFTYLLGLFGANLTGKETSTDAADQDVTQGIIGAITNVASAFAYSQSCPPATPGSTPGASNDNHCSVSPDGRQHFLHVRTFNFGPAFPGPPSPCTLLPAPLPPICPAAFEAGTPTSQLAGDQLSSFGDLLAS